MWMDLVEWARDDGERSKMCGSEKANCWFIALFLYMELLKWYWMPIRSSCWAWYALMVCKRCRLYSVAETDAPIAPTPLCLSPINLCCMISITRWTCSVRRVHFNILCAVWKVVKQMLLDKYIQEEGSNRVQQNRCSKFRAKNNMKKRVLFSVFFLPLTSETVSRQQTSTFWCAPMECLRVKFERTLGSPVSHQNRFLEQENVLKMLANSHI